MKQYLLLASVLFLFNACGGGGSSSSNVSVDRNITNQDNNISDSSIGLFENEQYGYTQWAVYKNESFYSSNSINSDAHINPQNTYNTYTGKGVRVAIIDDGFDVTHPDLSNRILRTINASGSGDSTDVSHSLKTENHGTAVAGIIGANSDGIGIRGIAPNAGLILIKMKSVNDSAETIALFQKAIDAGADIINCSWGTGNVDDAVKNYLIDIGKIGRDGKGVIVVFASGNKNELMGNDESAISSVIGVGATDHTNLRTSYSNYGPRLDVVAPGGGKAAEDLGISTLDPVSSSGVIEGDYTLHFNSTFVGTSASAPVLSGALALALEANPNLTLAQIQELLQVSSSKIGLNVPYLEDTIITNSQTPTISGLLGSSKNSNFNLYIRSSTNIEYGPYSIVVDSSNWSSRVSDTLPVGVYSAILKSTNDNSVLATDDSFEIDISKSKKVGAVKNDYYGYGKLNLSSLISGALAY